MSEVSLLQPLRDHPLFFRLADQLEKYVGLPRDLIQWAEFLSLAAGKMAIPINLEIVSEHWTADLHIANRILDLLPDSVQRVDTDSEFRQLEKSTFANIAVILVRDNHPQAFHNFVERTARSVSQNGGLPSLWRISAQTSAVSADQSTLRLMTPHANRELACFGAAFAAAPEPDSKRTLSGLLRGLPTSPHYPRHFCAYYAGMLTPLAALLLERLLQVFAALRVHMPGEDPAEKAVLLEDYRAARALLTNLPLAPVDRRLSAGAVVTAETVFNEVANDAYQLALPDHSDEGNKWFTRDAARAWSKLAYNTVKDHLEELENVAIVRSTRPKNDRGRGRAIYYRFVPNIEPPFQSQNPFDGLPNPAPDDCPP